jgi:hypothetical protein
MKQSLVPVLLVLVAMGSYIAGSVTGVMILIGAGVVLELAFWFGLVQRRRAKGRHAWVVLSRV